ncbi:hypothetical protein ACFL34_04525, partial [Candidatus Sumerlaeota bacterium]
IDADGMLNAESDGQTTITAESGPIGSNTVTVYVTDENIPPSVARAWISPMYDEYTPELRVHTEGWFDLDGDPEDYRYQWKVNDVAVPGQTGPTLAKAFFSTRDRIACTVTPWDGQVTGASVEAGPVSKLAIRNWHLY